MHQLKVLTRWPKSVIMLKLLENRKMSAPDTFEWYHGKVQKFPRSVLFCSVWWHISVVRFKGKNIASCSGVIQYFPNCVYGCLPVAYMCVTAGGWIQSGGVIKVDGHQKPPASALGSNRSQTLQSSTGSQSSTGHQTHHDMSPPHCDLQCPDLGLPTVREIRDRFLLVQFWISVQKDGVEGCHLIPWKNRTVKPVIIMCFVNRKQTNKQKSTAYAGKEI